MKVNRAAMPLHCDKKMTFPGTFINYRVWSFTQIQLADEKSTIKALRKRQEKDREEMEKLNTEFNV